MLGAKHGFAQSMDGKRGYTLRADNPWIVSRAIPQTARTRTYVSSIVRDIELCDQLASYSDTLQKRRPWLTEKRSRTIYIRIRTVLVHRILPVSMYAYLRNATRSERILDASFSLPESTLCARRSVFDVLANPRFF